MDCQTVFFPPGPLCPYCGSDDLNWRTADEGVLYSFTRQHRTAPGFDAPLVMGIVELNAGPRLLALVEAAYNDLIIGQPVRIEPQKYDHDYDRGRHAGRPFFVAVPTNNTEVE
jgi:uncharacterized OB-fold protein